MPRLLAVTALACVFSGAMQTAAPPSDVYLAAFTSQAGKITIGQPANISNGPGYDNQPSFTPDGQQVLFTSVRGNQKPDPANSAATGSDIYGYDIGSGRLTQLTSTAESEYSPTVTPGGAEFSVIRVEADGTQRLWRFPLAGGKPELVLANVKPVGYHAWIDRSTVALFVLGSPATLQVANTATGGAQVIARDIGRSLQRIPGGGVSFVQRETTDGTVTLTVMRLEPGTHKVAPLVRVPEGAQNPDFTWTPDGTLLLAHGGTLLRWRRGDDGFSAAVDLDAMGLTGVTRIAVSPRGDRIALVAQQ